jgi:hypothetical protein
MDRKDTLKKLIIIFGFILLILTVFEYLIRAFSIALDPLLMY